MDNFKYVVYLYSCGARGKKIDEIIDIDIDEIYEISVKHGIWGMVFSAISALYAENKNVFGLTKEKYEKYNSHFTRSISQNILKWTVIPKILSVLEGADIDTCLLKGMTIADSFHEPYVRTTTDIDLLIDSKKLKTARNIMEGMGFEILYRSEGSHHLKCIRKDVGLIELHTQLYDKEVQDLWFDMGGEKNKYEYIDFEFENIKCKQLNYNDAMIFNFLHFFKHYITGIVTIKHVMDVLMFFQKHRNETDIKTFEKKLEDIRCDKLFKALKCVGIKYMNFSLTDVDEDETIFRYSEFAEGVMTDINKYAANENAKIYNAYTQEVYRRKAKQRDKTKRKIFNSLKLIFVNKKRMKEIYPFLEKYSWLMPIMYVYRFFSKIFNAKKYINMEKDNSVKENDFAEDRLQLMKKLDIM